MKTAKDILESTTSIFEIDYRKKKEAAKKVFGTMIPIIYEEIDSAANRGKFGIIISYQLLYDDEAVLLLNYFTSKGFWTIISLNSNSIMISWG